MAKSFNYFIIWVTIAVVMVVVVCVVSHFVRRDRDEATVQGVVECRTYRAAPKVAGRIDTMFVAEGDLVERGELLYTIATPELDAKQEQVNALYMAAEALEKEVDMGARKQQKDAALQMWNKAKAGLELAKQVYDRVAQLYDKGVVPRQQYDEALANLDAMRATERAAYAEYQLAMDGASVEQKMAAYAKVNEALGGVREVASYRDGAIVFAPIGGRVSNIISYAGELVSAGLPVVTISDLSDIWVAVSIREDMMRKLYHGAVLSGYVPALDKTLDFVVYYISVEADYATWSATRAHGDFDMRSFEVRMRCMASEDGLLPGMSVMVDMTRYE